MLMDKKSTETNWGKMIDAIKISITVYPIVFAAVTAQGFKTWASYRVERGVKLMELEQLIGSNSFGAVMKQPFLLRRLDLLTVGIFVIWALSPIGSQALIRSYALKRGEITDTVPVAYVPIMGDNMLLTPNARNEIKNATHLSELWQMVSVYYVGSSMSAGTKAGTNSVYQDMYNHPVPVIGFDNIPTLFSGYGVPLVLPSPVVNPYSESENDKSVAKAAAKAELPFETLKFNTTSSVFKFTCGEWRKETRAVLDEKGYVSWSLSETLGLEFLPDPNFKKDVNDTNAPMTGVRYAGLLDHTKLLNRTMWKVVVPQPDWLYGVIDCRWEQIFYKGTVECHADVKTQSNSYDCEMRNVETLSAGQVKPEWRTVLRDFSEELVLGATPYPVHYPVTPSKCKNSIHISLARKLHTLPQLLTNFPS